MNIFLLEDDGMLEIIKVVLREIHRYPAVPNAFMKPIDIQPKHPHTQYSNL